MAKVLVKQMDFNWNGITYEYNELRRDVDCYRGEDLARIILNNKDRLKTVASMVMGGKLSDILEDAYRLTNNIDSPWMGGEVLEIGTVSEDAKGRSTSIGDVVVVEGVEYMVDSFGFTCLDDIELEEVA